MSLTEIRSLPEPDLKMLVESRVNAINKRNKAQEEARRMEKSLRKGKF